MKSHQFLNKNKRFIIVMFKDCFGEFQASSRRNNRAVRTAADEQAYHWDSVPLSSDIDRTVGKACISGPI
jgi:hypothetical protein